jgi:hypothetical protein
MSDTNGPLRAVVQRIPRIIGAAFGTAVGVQMGDPVAGAAVGEVMSQVSEDFVNHVLSTRQEERVATVLDLAAREVARRIENGESVRGDGMFATANAQSVELTEGVLLAARDEHQAKKLPYIANLYASIVTNEQITMDVANLAIRDAEDLTWTEMCLIGILLHPDDFPLPDTDLSRTGTGWDDWAVAQSLYLLKERDYVYSPRGIDSSRGFPRIDTRMSAVRLNNRGKLIAGMMGLQVIPAEDIRPVYDLLLRAAEHHAEKEAAKAEDGSATREDG